MQHLEDQNWRVGIDIGGTFTDLVLMDDSTGAYHVAKVLTTPAEPALAVCDGLAGLLEKAGVAAQALRQVIHGTTLVTNALIERKGAKTALLTTEGFRDAVVIGKEHRYDMYDLFLEKPQPLAPRHLRLDVRERMLDDGTVLAPLDEDQVARHTQRLKEQGVEAVAVSFLHSYRNPAHEEAAARVIRELAPEMALSLSSEVAPEIREYERTSTVLANVYVRPRTERYLQKLQGGLADMGFRGRLLIMLSNGGVATVETASRFPIRLLESGPSAGAIACCHHGERAHFPNLLSFDMGGTTAKSCIIEDGKPMIASEFEVARMYRFKQGSGLPIKISVIEMMEIGAGGGSIAHVDALGLLKVGPQSAGADPGPVCYGRGGTRPTVTDADVVLGYLNPDFFLGGQMKLDREAALEAIDSQIARPLGLSPVQAAWGIHQIVNENMANAARVHAIERGKDLRGFPLFAFGGCGPVHAFRVAQILGVDALVVPPDAGAASAFGLLCAPLAFDFARSLGTALTGVDWDATRGLLGDLTEEGLALLADAGIARADASVEFSCDMRYVGQGHEIRVPLEAEEIGPECAQFLQRAYVEEYIKLYGRTCPDVELEAITWRVRVSGPPPRIQEAPHAARGAGAHAEKGQRSVYLPSLRDFTDVPVYDRYALSPGDRLEGPAVIEENESTIVIGEGSHAQLGSQGNVIVRWKS